MRKQPVGYCGKCGSALPADHSRFCHACGAPVDAASVFPARPGASVPLPPKKRRTGVYVTLGLLVLLVVITIPVVKIGLPTFQDQVEKSRDAAAQSLVRNAMTAIESAYIDLRTFDPAMMTAVELSLIEPTIVWKPADDSGAAAIWPHAQSQLSEVDYFGTDLTYSVGTVSETGRSFGVTVDKGPGGYNTFYNSGHVVSSW